MIVAACGDADKGATPTGPTSTATTSTTSGVTTTSAPTTASTVVVGVFFGIESSTTCSRVVGHERRIPPGADPITVAFAELLGGPTAEETADGAGSWFSAATAGMLRHATLTGDRLAIDFVDFSRVIPNASTSCGSEALLAELNATGFQFSQVNRITYSFEGSCKAFGEWLQMSCIEIARSDWIP